MADLIDLRLIIYPNNVLEQPCEDIDVFDDSTFKLVNKMLDVMYNSKGIGLAAPQIGVLKRVIVYDISEDQTQPQTLINPIISGRSKDLIGIEEGCLSFPDLSIYVPRAKRINIEGFDVEGKKRSLQADDLLSICLQHETDHLDGITFLNRVPRKIRRRSLKSYQKNLRRIK